MPYKKTPHYLRKFPSSEKRFQKLVNYYKRGQEIILKSHNKTEADSLLKSNKKFALVLKSRYLIMKNKHHHDANRLEEKYSIKKKKLLYKRREGIVIPDAELKYKHRLLDDKLADFKRLHKQLSDNHHYIRQLVKVHSMQEAYREKYGSPKPK